MTMQTWGGAVNEDGSTESNPVNLLALFVALLFITSVAALRDWLIPLAMLGAVVGSILIHEAGHLFAAKWGGMKVTEYFAGFGPRLWSVRKGETEYGVKLLLPLGGYCRIVGMTNLEDVDPQDESRTYRQATYPRRLASVLAGVGFQLVLVIILLWVMNAFVGVIKEDPNRLEVGTVDAPVAGAPTPAKDAGLRAGDEIVAVDGQTVTEDRLGEYLRSHPGQPVALSVERDGRPVTITVTPVDRKGLDLPGFEPVTEPTGYVGISYGSGLKQETVNPVAAVGRAFGDFGSYAKGTVSAFGQLFSPEGIGNLGKQVTNGEVSEEDEVLRPSSVVGIARFADDATEEFGLNGFLTLVVVLNMFIGMVNLVPLLPLDGGHAAIATYERIRSRAGQRYSVDVTKLMPIAMVVLFFLVFLGLTAVWLDIFRPVSL